MENRVVNNHGARETGRKALVTTGNGFKVRRSVCPPARRSYTIIFRRTRSDSAVYACLFMKGATEPLVTKAACYKKREPWEPSMAFFHSSLPFKSEPMVNSKTRPSSSAALSVPPPSYAENVSLPHSADAGNVPPAPSSTENVSLPQPAEGGNVLPPPPPPSTGNTSPPYSAEAGNVPPRAAKKERPAKSLPTQSSAEGSSTVAEQFTDAGFSLRIPMSTCRLLADTNGR